ncbi:unnamed protein product [Thelazia callipaeda]|uniref:Serine protease K12H4.7 n=1 Tax=Thelazia callipaeda TaxID=103827 RepID=A0A0N5D6M2_THECL|nr:unnamed protein product [Thelazia callipaeda]
MVIPYCIISFLPILILSLTTNDVSGQNFNQFHRFLNRRQSFWKHSTELSDSSIPLYQWDETEYPYMPIDHFTYRNSDHFALRYLTNYSYFECSGPLFFYAGNEGSIEGFAVNTGIMWNLALSFKAALVFAEHRYYGKSMPFGNDSYTYVTKLGYLSAAQALADFAELIYYLKMDISKYGHCPQDTEIPVIVFGGSYGGMLAAWLRMKYPHIVNGAWASSAPVRNFDGSGVSPDLMSNITTRVYVDSGCSRDAFSKGFEAIKQLSNSDSGIKALNEIFHAKPGYEMQSAKDFEDLYDYITAAIFYMAMTDYPYPADFLEALPAFPVKYACTFAKEAPTNETELAKQLYNVINVFYNYTGALDYNCFTANCYNSYGALDAGSGWVWQSCTSMTMQLCDSGGENDFFLKTCNESKEIEQMLKDNCFYYFKTIGYTEDFYHTKEPAIRYGLTYFAASNIIFSNGNLDPWSAGGVYDDSPGIQQAKKNGVYTFYMLDAAHHLDLRSPNTCDPPSVMSARHQIVRILQCWVYNNCTELPSPERLPDNSEWKLPTECKYINESYPWGYESKVCFV